MKSTILGDLIYSFTDSNVLEFIFKCLHLKSWHNQIWNGSFKNSYNVLAYLTKIVMSLIIMKLESFLNRGNITDEEIVSVDPVDI